uniref:Saposin B-type domain-containing protein n=1 Tax=Electrophorus electricus TaxID=8005 RepID=A0A4W4GZW3_ELEEL
MLQNILICVLFACSACAMHLEYLKIESAEDDLLNSVLDQYYESEGLSETLPKTGADPFCWACKWVVKKVKKHLITNAKAEVIKNKLLQVCDQIRLMKTKCKKMVTKYMDVLTDELSTTDDPQTVCINVGICKSNPIWKFIQDSQQTHQKL